MKNIVRTLVLLVIIVVNANVQAGISVVKKRLLSDSDRHVLLDAKKFNETIGKNGWYLSDRLIDGVQISDVVVSRGEVKDVDILKTKILNSVFKNVVFRNVKFHEGLVKNTTFENVIFEKCEFVFQQMQSAKCVRCRFVESKVERGSGEKNIFEHTEFSNFEELKSSYKANIYSDVKYTKSKINIEFYDSEFIDYTLEDVVCIKGKYGSKKIKNMHVIGGEFEGNMFGDIDGFIAEKAKKYTIGFGRDSKVRNIAIRNVNILIDPTFSSNSSHEDVIIENVDVISDLTVGGNVKHFLVRNSKLGDLYFLKANVDGDVTFSNSKITGLTMEESQVSGLKFVDSSIDGYLYLRNNKFKGLTFINSRVLQGADIEVESNQYIDSQEFPIDK